MDEFLDTITRPTGSYNTCRDKFTSSLNKIESDQDHVFSAIHRRIVEYILCVLSDISDDLLPLPMSSDYGDEQVMYYLQWPKECLYICRTKLIYWNIHIEKSEYPLIPELTEMKDKIK